MTQTFKTSYGDEIEIIPGYFDYIRDTVGLRTTPEAEHLTWAQNAGAIDYDAIAKNVTGDKGKTRISLKGVGVRLLRVYALIRMLQRAGVCGSFESSLDIGTGYGIQPRLLKMFGVSRKTTGIDINDRCSAINERVLKRQYRTIRRLDRLERAQWRAIQNNSTGPMRLFAEKAPLPCLQAWMCGGQFDQRVYSMPIVGKPELDEILIGDVHKISGRYDLITSFTSFEWFDHEDALRVAYRLLAPGGYLYVWTTNWWHDMTYLYLVGHFPFASQRLSRRDYFRYLDEWLPTQAPAYRAVYDMFTPKHPTLGVWLQSGIAEGLVPIAWDVDFQPRAFTKKPGITYRAYAEHSRETLSEVLDNIWRFRPDVMIGDLMYSDMGMLFHKPKTSGSLDADILRSGLAGIDNRAKYRPGLLGGIAKKILERTYLHKERK